MSFRKDIASNYFEYFVELTMKKMEKTKLEEEGGRVENKKKNICLK